MAEVRDATDLLVSQHARMEELFREILTRQGEARRGPFEELVRLLNMHEIAEEEVVHPLASTRIDAGSDVVESRLQEEEKLKELMAQLYESGISAPDFDERLLVLRDQVYLHAKREERYEFPRLRAATDPDTRQRLAEAVRAAEAAAPAAPHPGAQGAGSTPPQSMVDQVRAAVRKVLGHGPS